MSPTPPRSVFVSSTYTDLSDHRKAVWEVLRTFALTVRGMEQFGARSETPLQTCLAEVGQSDVYVGIVAFRFGSVDITTGKSFTQREYEYAVASGKDILIYLADDHNARVRAVDVDFDEASREKLLAFKRQLRERHTVSMFVDVRDLANRLWKDLSRYFRGESETDTLQAPGSNAPEIAGELSINETDGASSTAFPTLNGPSTILRAWLDVESMIARMADRVGCFGSPNAYMARRLHEAGVLNDGQLKTYRQLMTLRNRVAAGADATFSDADLVQYERRAALFVTELRRSLPPQP
jgi:hypothetical protein